MNLTNPEKLILIMLSEIYEKLGINKEIDTKLLKEAIFSDNTWALSWEMTGIVGDHPDPTPPIVSEVGSILNMWRMIDRSLQSFRPDEIKQIEQKTNFSRDRIRFDGFDGNNETRHLSITEFFVNDMGRFSELKNRELNSHGPRVERYKKMLTVYERFLPNVSIEGLLSTSQIIEILKA